MRILSRSLFLLFSIALFSSCEKIPPIGDRNLPPVDTVGNILCEDELLGYQPKTILIEEFTGVSCNNCPKAAREIKLLQSLYPCRIVAVGVHASNFAVPTSDYPDDFRTPAGVNLYNFTDPFGVPSGLIDRLDEGQQDFAKPFLSFGSEVQSILSQDTADIKIDNSYAYDTTTGELTVNVTFTNQKNLSYNPDLYWVSYITESKIIAPQKQPDNSKDPVYEHNFVLRATGNGAFGAQITGLGNTISSTSSTSVVIPFQSSWVFKNCELVTFVYDLNTYEVIQAQGTKLK
jgi:hypothetical protein